MIDCDTLRAGRRYWRGSVGPWKTMRGDNIYGGVGKRITVLQSVIMNANAPRHSAGLTDPTTPLQSSLRARNAGSATAGDSGSNASPTSTYSESTEHPLRLYNGSRTSGFATPFVTPARRPLLRTDPTLLTCFDPADKELYDLWAPKR